MTEELLYPAAEAPGPVPARRKVSTRIALLGLGAAVVVGGGAFYAGRATAPKGPATLADAVTAAQQGSLPCGDGSRLLTALCSRGAGGLAGLGGQGGFGGRFGGGANPGGGGRSGPAGAGDALGQVFGPGSVAGTVTSVGGGTLTLQTRAGDVDITLPSGVKVTTTTRGGTGDITQGSTVIVGSTTDANGNRVAETVFVLPAAGNR